MAQGPDDRIKLNQAGGENIPNIIDDILKKLEKNGDIDAQEYRRFMLLVTAELYRRTKPIKEIGERIKKLEDNSLILQARKHLKYSIPIMIGAVLFTIFVASRLDLIDWLGDVFTELTGIPLP